MKRLDEFTPVERWRIARFGDNLLAGIEIREELAKLSNEEFARVLMHVADDMIMESPQAILIEVAAERLGYKFNDVEPGMPKGYKFDAVTCPECGQPVAANWIVRHRKANCEVG